MAEDGGATLESLLCFDQLEVSAPQVEPRRIRATYRTRGGSADGEFELTYRYEEDVFFDDAASAALAAMILAQPALNYGLFCRELAFSAAHDAHDRQFLRDAAENTACEIYVNKLHAKNPFLVGVAQRLAFEQRASYLQATLRFCEEPAGPPSGWETDAGRYVVLSSGGKESLLSYGLLTEIAGSDAVTPAFVNESGRHWFSALNAHRHFSEHVPQTSRVWTNVDRFFNWMLRQIPFVRPDYAKLRADMYPLRLWTVSTFVFGALPIARRRGAGNLVVGDEYDTTQRTTYRGVTHYSALYDQSRYYDDALSRYYQRKGWNVRQYSVLRPLSELLIEKTLVERYPQLQQLQISCHAAHLDDSWARPCGRCEKCRRVVAMLLGLGADPRRCGYNDEQIAHTLATLPTNALHQERVAVEHLATLLAERGVLAAPHIGGVDGVARPEALCLRFDAENAPEDAVPAGLREPLYRLLLAHAAGVARPGDGRWEIS